MKKFFYSILVLKIILLFISCTLSEKNEIPYSQMFEENPVTISWQQ